MEYLLTKCIKVFGKLYCSGGWEYCICIALYLISANHGRISSIEKLRST